MTDLDFSFLRLRNNFDDAKNLGESPQVDSSLAQYSQVHLCPNETYFQTSNSPTSISFNDNYEVYIVDECGNELEDVTERVFLEEWFDDNGIKQISWEYVNGAEYYMRPISLRFRNTVNDDKWWTNLFVSTEFESELTAKIIYRHFRDHYGTQYSRNDRYQCIRLSMYLDYIDDDVEVGSYTQITDGKRRSSRPTITDIETYKLDTWSHWAKKRLTRLLFCNEIYLNGNTVSYTDLMEVQGREMDSNFYEGELTVNVDYNRTMSYEYQLFSGFSIIELSPYGLLSECTVGTDARATFDVVPTLGTGTMDVYTSGGSLVASYDQTELSIEDNSLYASGILDLELAEGDYYVQFSAGLVSYIGIEHEGISDTTTWTFTIGGGQYDPTQYDSTQYYTGCPDPLTDNLVMFYKFNETSGTTATDSVGDNDGVITGVTIDETGLVDKCYYFNSGGATDEYVTIPDADSLSFGSGAFSIEVWVKPDNNFGYILNKYNETTTDLEYRLYVQSGTIQFFIYTDASNRIGVADNATYSAAGGWQQVVVTYDGSGDASGLKMFINNTASSFSGVETGTYTGMPNTEQPVILGQQSDALTGSNRFQGKMDILRIWKGYELTADDIGSFYNSGNGTEN